MPRQPVDLAAHINQTVEAGHPAAFPVALEPVFRANENTVEEIPSRRAVVRQDTKAVLAVVSDRYQLVPHQRILDLVEQAFEPLDVGSVPRGLYVDRGGARMRAIYKFPTLAKPIREGDTICPCLKIQNSYDGTSRVAVHIGAFRFVCTNLAVGGGGVFAGGFMSVHVGEVPIAEVALQLADYLSRFEAIVALYSRWADEALQHEVLAEVLKDLPPKPAMVLQNEIAATQAPTVLSAYNAATRYATHEMRSYRGAFELLARVNAAFQRHAAPAA